MTGIAFFDTRPYDRAAFEKAAEGHDLSVKFFETKLCADTVRLAEGCDGVCIFVNDTADAQVIDALCAMGVKFIALRCTGYNNVDTAYADGRLRIVHVPGYSPYAVAEHAMGLLLTSARRIHKAYIRTKGFNFSLNDLTGFELHGKTVGVIGTGAIGRVFISICRGFGMDVLAYDPYPAEGLPARYVQLDELFSQSDIISLHCPLTKETRHLINKNTVDKMKTGVIIVNTSRGGLMDGQALLDGIKDRKIGAACLDVYEEESDVFFEDVSGHIMDDDILARLISMPNVILTSHQAFLTEEALLSIARTTVENIETLISGGECANELCIRK